MKTFLIIASVFLSATVFGQTPTYSRAKILTGSQGLQAISELGVPVDHGTLKHETFFISDFSDKELDIIRNAGYTVEILIEDVQSFYINQNKESQSNEKNVNCQGANEDILTPDIPSNFNLGSMGGFYTYQEFLDELDAMATQYPNLITARAPISTFLSHEGRPLYWLRLSDNPGTDEAEPEVLHTAIHHAREPNALSEVIFYMWYLLENYATNDEVQYLVDNTEIYFVPMINPDGYVYNETNNPNGGGMWRKNRKNNGDGTYGVDLNRNYSRAWGTTGISMDPASDVYPGTGPFSEPETQAIKWFCENRDFQYALNAHTYGDLLLFPYGNEYAEYAEDHDYFTAFTNHMTEYNHYTAEKSSFLYLISGGSDDYMYGEDTVIKPEIFAMTPEVSGTQGGFWPNANQITSICQEMLFTNMRIAHLTHKYLVIRDYDPEYISATSGQFNHVAERLGIEDGPLTVSITPLLGIQSVGPNIVYDLDLMEITSGYFTYTLNPGIQQGDLVRYVMNTDNGTWVKHDTITKIFGTLNVQVLDEANTAANWTGDWEPTNVEYLSPSQSFTDSPWGYYDPYAYSVYTYNNPINLDGASDAMIRFYAKWWIESDFDYCQFQVSTDGGTTWQGQCGLYTLPGLGGNGSMQPDGEPLYEGIQETWVQETISLSDYIDQEIRVRFLMESDGNVTFEGFYFDDFQIIYSSEASVPENGLTNALLVPNPANQTAVVSFQNVVSEASIAVYDTNGKLVHEQQLKQSDNKMEFSVANWEEGIYFVHVTNEKGSQSPLKLTVIH